MKKLPYSPHKIRIVEWTGRPAEVGDELVNTRGSRFQIIRIAGKTHHCITLPPGEPVTTPQHGIKSIQRWGRKSR